MRKILTLLLLTLMCVGVWAQTNLGIANWTGEATFPVVKKSDGSTNVTRYVDANIAPLCVKQDGVVIGAGDLTVTFQYKAPSSWGLSIVGVDLVKDGQVVYSDYHSGFTGGSNNLNVYTLSGVEQGTYTFRYWLPRYQEKTDGGGDLTTTTNGSNGTISYLLDGTPQDQFINTSYALNTTFKDLPEEIVPSGLWDVMRTELMGTRSWQLNAVCSEQNAFDFSKNSGVRYNDQTVTLEEKSYYVYYRYSGGGHGLTIKAVELLDANGKKVSIDYNLENNPADAFTGNQKRNATFKFTAPKAGTYTLRTIIGNGDDMDTKGNIYYYEASDLEGQFAAMKNVIVQKRLLYPKSSLDAAQNVINYTVADDNYSQLGDYLYAVKDLSGANVNTLTADKYYTIRGTFNIQNAVDRYVINNDGTLAANTIDGDIPANACWKYTNNTFQSASDPTKYIAVSNGNMMLHTSGKAFTLEKGVLFGNIAIKSDNIYMALSTNGAIDHFSDNKHNPYGQYSTDFIIEEIVAPVDELTQAKRIAQALIEANTPLVIGKPSKAVRDELQSVLDKEDVTVEELNAAITAYNTTTNIYLPDGYYYMKNLDGNRYVYNDYSHDGNTNHYTLVSNNKVTTNNGVWYIENNGDGSINIKNGEGQPMKGDYDFGATLHFGVSQVDGGIYFTEGIHFAKGDYYKLNDGTYYITNWQHPESAGSNYTFEPVSYQKVYNINVTSIIPEDYTGGTYDNEGYVEYNSQKAMDGGFFCVGNVMVNEENTTTKEYSGLTAYYSADNNNNITYTYRPTPTPTQTALLEGNIKNLHEWLNNYYTVGYPDSKNEMVMYAFGGLGGIVSGISSVTIQNYYEVSEYLDYVLNCEDINMPVDGEFYILQSAAGNLNDSDIFFAKKLDNGKYTLLSYKTGKYLKSSAIASVGTVGEYTVRVAKNEQDKVVFGHCELVDEEGNLLNVGGDDWFITQTTTLPITVNANTGYGTFCSPVPVQLTSGKAYTAEFIGEHPNFTIKLHELGNVIPANTGVVVTGTTECTTLVTGVVPTDFANDLKGSIETFVNAPENFEGENNYALVLTADNNNEPVFRRYIGTNVVGFKAYYPFKWFNTSSSSVDFKFVIDDDNLTSLDDAVKATSKSTTIYDLNGNKIVNPIKGQIYIIGGNVIKY